MKIFAEKKFGGNNWSVLSTYFFYCDADGLVRERCVRCVCNFVLYKNTESTTDGQQVERPFCLSDTHSKIITKYTRVKLTLVDNPGHFRVTFVIHLLHLLIKKNIYKPPQNVL